MPALVAGGVAFGIIFWQAGGRLRVVDKHGLPVL